MNAYLQLLFVYWKEAIVYKAEFILSMLVVPFRFIVLVMIWTAVYESTTSVGSYSLPDLITYFMISTLVMALTKDVFAEELEEGVKAGHFITYMLQPTNYVFAMFVKKLSYRLFGTLVEVLPLVVIFLLFFADYLVKGDVILFSISTLFAFIISFELNVLIGSLAFWLINIRTLSWLIWLGIYISSGAFIPLDLFSKVVQKFFVLLPFQYIGFVPVNVYLGKYVYDFSFTGVYFTFVAQAIWCVLLGLLIIFVWRKGIRRFGGVGT